MTHRRDTGSDDPRVRVRPTRRGAPPRTKRRPDHSGAEEATVLAVDRGRYALLTDTGTRVVAMKARELGHGAKNAVVVGDRVGIVGDTSGREGSLARIVRIAERRTVLRRSAEDREAAGVERVIVANADQLVIVTALADPEPRPRMIDRCLVAAFDAGMTPILCLTKSDIADAAALLEQYAPLGVTAIVTAVTKGDEAGSRGLAELRDALTGRTSVLVGHSGVGKSTLINALIPQAERATSHVNPVTGRGRHTSSSAVALPLPGGGWAIDTPGVRSFGLAHVGPEDLLRGFGDLHEAAAECPRGCTHAADAPDCALDEWAQADGQGDESSGGGNGAGMDAGAGGTPDDRGVAASRRARLDSFRRLLAARQAEPAPGGDGGR